MKRTIGLTFTVNYRYTRDVPATGRQRTWVARWTSDGDFMARGIQRFSAAGQLIDTMGYPETYDEAHYWQHTGTTTVTFGTFSLFRYTARDVPATGRYTTTIRIVD